MSTMKLVMFTDLDGTLLDARTYSFDKARSALGLVGRLETPLVVCTSKTRAEILYWREMLGNSDPFVSENGGGVFIPPGYFGFDISDALPSGGYLAVGLGTPYKKLREAVAKLRARGFDIAGFGDMTAGEVSRLTGLEPEQARLSMRREFDEPFVIRGDAGPPPALLDAIGRLGLGYTSGRLMHILGGTDKGRAVRYLAGLYGRKFGGVVTAAIGDSLNDAQMLASVDHAFLVRKPDGAHDPGIGGTRVTKVDGIGPEGWAEAVHLLAGRLGLE